MSETPSRHLEWDAPCVHCGLCLDTCATYRTTGREADSPRGRLYLMDAVIEGTMRFDRDVIEHLDSCLGCLACESACPSGVRYGSRIESFRERLAREDPRVSRRAGAWLAHKFRRARVARNVGRLATMLDTVGLEKLRRRFGGLGLMPRQRVPRTSELVDSPKTPRLRIALLVGCVADQLQPTITSATINVLRRNDIEVDCLAAETCCGALDLHSGDLESAIRSMSALSRAVKERRVDYVVTTAAGCGAMLRRYGTLTSEPNEDVQDAYWVGRNSRDISELLVEIGFRWPRADPLAGRTVAYHDACHLVHGCNVDQAPRDVLTAAGVRWFDLGENAICCGSAGIYNLLHPDFARELGRRKADLILGQNASDVAVGNIGCIMQLERALMLGGRRDIGVWHPVELLEAAYCREVAG